MFSVCAILLFVCLLVEHGCSIFALDLLVVQNLLSKSIAIQSVSIHRHLACIPGRISIYIMKETKKKRVREKRESKEG